MTKVSVAVGIAIIFGASCQSSGAELAVCERELAATRTALAVAQQVRLEAAPAATEVEATPAPEAPAEPQGTAPITPLWTVIEPNSAGTPELSIRIVNDGEKVIDAFVFEAELYDNFGEPVRDRLHRDRGNVARFQWQADNAREHIRPEDGVSRRTHWPLYRHDSATKAIVTVVRVHFTDNTSWEGRARQSFDPRGTKSYDEWERSQR